MAQSFEEFMAQSGRQGELDQLRRTGQFDSAKRAYESGEGFGSDFQRRLDEELAEVAKYVEELEKVAKDDFNFITKFLDKMHRVALGNDDEATAKFYESVSNSLEEKIGRIPFDFQRKTQREKEDLQEILKQTAGQRRLIADTSAFQKEQETTERREEFNRRGLLGSGIEKRKAENQERARQLALRQQIEPIDVRERLARTGEVRGLEDITTTSRRDLADFQLGEQEKREKADIDLARELARIQREKSAEERGIRKLLPGVFEEDELAGNKVFT